MVCKIVIWIFVVILLVLLIIVATLVLPLLAMKPEETGIVEGSDISAVKNRKNDMFFIQNGDEYILIDAGSDIQAVSLAMCKLDISPKQVKSVLLTHSDGDHVTGLELFGESDIYINEKEMPLINREIVRAPLRLRYNSLPQGVDRKRLVGLQDGQMLQFGVHTIECIQTVGHTLGSMSFLLDNKYLFTGDAIRIKSGELVRHPYTMNKAESDRSIKKIKKLHEDGIMLLTAHYGYLK